MKLGPFLDKNSPFSRIFDEKHRSFFSSLAAKAVVINSGKSDTANSSYVAEIPTSAKPDLSKHRKAARNDSGRPFRMKEERCLASCAIVLVAIDGA
jgi:hypothetical protein